jgi:hypothetical protein
MTNGKASRKSHSTIRKEIERATLWVTIASTFVAVAAAGAAFWSSWEAHESRINDERPFPTPEPVQLKPGEQSTATPPFIKINVQNNGKSSAKKILITCKSEIETAESHVTWNAQESKSPTDTFPYLAAAVWLRVACPSPPHYTIPASGTAVELGTVQYHDVSDRNFVTPFCFTFAVPYTNNPDVHQCSETRNLPELE